MFRMTRLPADVACFLAPLKRYFSYRHYLVFCWVLVARLTCFEKATLQALARQLPRHVAAWHVRRLLAAGRWPWQAVLTWLVQQALVKFPPPRDGVLYLVGDSTLKAKRAKRNPWVKKGRLSSYATYTWGLHLVLVLAQWENYRIPVGLPLGAA